MNNGKAVATDAIQLPDGSGVSVGSYPLPKDHWIYAADESGLGSPPMHMRMGTISPLRAVFAKALKAAGQYAIRNCTQRGQDMDFDPDAMLQELQVGLFGYFTENGLANDALDVLELTPRLFAPALTLPRALVKNVAMANGFTEKPQPGLQPDLHPYVYEFANAIGFCAVEQMLGELATGGYLNDIEIKAAGSGQLTKTTDEVK